MADLTINQPTRQANPLTWQAASAGGDALVNTTNRMLLIRNNNGTTARTLTIITQNTIDAGAGGLAVADLSIVIGAGEIHALGPWPNGFYNDGDNKVQLTYDDPADLELMVLNMQA